MATLAIRKTARAATINKKIKDHSNDPFVQKKLHAAKKLINKHGLPKALK